MKIELKKIHHSPQLSKETEAFTADLYIKGIHAGYAENAGQGGPTDYYRKDEKGKELIRKAETWCKALPPKQYPAQYGMEAYSLDINLEQYIDDLLLDHLQKKELARFNKKMEKAMEKGIVYGIAGDSFTTLAFSVPLAKVLDHPKATSIIKDAIVSKVLPNLKNGNIILNTNIPESILKEAGLKEGQYVKPLVGDMQQGIKPRDGENEQENSRGRSR